MFCACFAATSAPSPVRSDISRALSWLAKRSAVAHPDREAGDEAGRICRTRGSIAFDLRYALPVGSRSAQYGRPVRELQVSSRLCADGSPASPDNESTRKPPPPAFLPVALQRRWRRWLGCESCGDTRAVQCPNCAGLGGYLAMGDVGELGRWSSCRACRSTGRVICRACFVGDGWDLEGIRRQMSVPD